MANRIMYKSEAERYLSQNGWKLFLDLCIKDKVIVFDDPKLTPDQSEAREKFRHALDAVGHPEATCYSHWALEAYDIAFNPDFRK